MRMIQEGATHIAVATDLVIESYRYDLWAGYKTGEGSRPTCWRRRSSLSSKMP
jgi:hypothetical protein